MADKDYFYAPVQGPVQVPDVVRPSIPVVDPRPSAGVVATGALARGALGAIGLILTPSATSATDTYEPGPDVEGWPYPVTPGAVSVGPSGFDFKPVSSVPVDYRPPVISVDAVDEVPVPVQGNPVSSATWADIDAHLANQQRHIDELHASIFALTDRIKAESKIYQDRLWEAQKAQVRSYAQSDYERRSAIVAEMGRQNMLQAEANAAERRLRKLEKQLEKAKREVADLEAQAVREVEESPEDEFRPSPVEVQPDPGRPPVEVVTPDVPVEPAPLAPGAASTPEVGVIVDVRPDGAMRVRNYVDYSAQVRRRDSKFDSQYPSVLRVVNRTLGTLTEAMDFIEAFVWNIREADGSLSVLYAGSYRGALVRLARGEAELDVQGWLMSWALNELWDQLAGRLAKRANKGMLEAGWSGIQGPTYGPATGRQRRSLGYAL